MQALAHSRCSVGLLCSHSLCSTSSGSTQAGQRGGQVQQEPRVLRDEGTSWNVRGTVTPKMRSGFGDTAKTRR